MMQLFGLGIHFGALTQFSEVTCPWSETLKSELSSSPRGLKLPGLLSDVDLSPVAELEFAESPVIAHVNIVFDVAIVSVTLGLRTLTWSIMEVLLLFSLSLRIGS